VPTRTDGEDAAQRAATTHRVRTIVRRWGWNATSYQILNPGFSYWLAPADDAVVGYIERHGVRVVGGAPICAPARFGDVVTAFEHDATAAGCGVAYFAAEVRLAGFARADHRRVTFPIGAQPVWSPASLLREFATHASLRAQLSRARNKGVITRHVPVVGADLAAALRVPLDEWIHRRALPPLHFLIETETLDDLVDRRVVVAECGGAVVGFLVATPIPARNGWLIEQLVRGARAPNGTAELLLHHATSLLDDENAAMVTLGLAPLARRGTPVVQRAPAWTPILLRRLRAHGRRFFNFEGLEQFKAKFGGSSWEAVYLSMGRGTGTARALVAVTEAFGGEALWRFAGRIMPRRVRGGK
jgi:phosphatidylglycerol lysyltransferase